MDPSDDTYLGRVAYEGYRNASRGVSLVSGQDLPTWDGQSHEIRSAWCAAAQAVQDDLAEGVRDEVAEAKFVEPGD